jgi:hypothetical protein
MSMIPLRIARRMLRYVRGLTSVTRHSKHISCGAHPRIAVLHFKFQNLRFQICAFGPILLVLLSGCFNAPTASESGKATNPKTVRVLTPTSNKPAIGTSAANVEKAPAQTAGTILKFRDVTRDWGLNFTRFDDVRGENRNMEANGGGIAIFDYDLDGQLDLFFTQGGKLPLKKFSQDLSNELLRNRGTGESDDHSTRRLEPVTSAAGLTATGFHTGCAVGDLDADGFPDLYVTAFGKSTVWMNLGDGSFADITESSHGGVDTWGTSIALADFNGDGWLDVFVATYLKLSDDPPTICKEPRSPTGTSQCSPTLIPALDDVLFVNDGQGGLINVTQEAGITAPDGKGLGVVALDDNGDGKLDLHVANDMAPSFLYINETPDKEQRRLPGTEFGIALNGEGKATAAMGIAYGDYDRDGWIDHFVTNFYLETNTLFRNLEGQGFADLSSTSRLGPPSRETLAFGTDFLDIDHDGWMDLVVTTGHIEDRTWTGNELYRMRPHLFRNERNGRFTDVAESGGSYFAAKWVGRSMAMGDLDRDGDLDLVMAQQIDPSAVLLNETPAPNTSVIIKLVGRNGSPRNGIGTRVTAKGVTPVLMRVMAGGGGFQSASAQEIHLPLGDLKVFEKLEFSWPSGHTDFWGPVDPGYYVAIEERGLVRMHFPVVTPRQH